MKPILLIVLLSLFAVTANAQTEQKTYRSVEKFVADDSIDLADALRSKAIVTRPASDPAGEESKDSFALRSDTTANRHDQNFWIYDADVSLLSDLDGDGYHHALNVSFDIDVNYDSATVYAKLYLSKNGGPWSQYHTTKLFNIYGEDYSDEYEVTTELFEGYRPGYYSVLVEVFSLNHDHMVTSEILDYYYLGRDTRLEDLSWDEDDSYVSGQVSYSYGGGGGFSLYLLALLLIFQVVIAARGNLTLTPVKL